MFHLRMEILSDNCNIRLVGGGGGGGVCVCGWEWVRICVYTLVQK